MFDPFPFRVPPLLRQLTLPLAEYADLPTLPFHIHEVLFAAILYQVILAGISPAFSSFVFGDRYRKLSTRTRFNWDVHVVSLFQSVLVCYIALYVAINDKERNGMNWQERIYGYTGALGLVQAFACGYFVWDLYICTRYYSMFGPGMLAHAISALNVYSFGFRPFVNYYSTSFILYELSSPFLNIHWFCDKLDMTGSTLQLVNGAFLLVSFAGARLFYGTYISASMLYDIYRAVNLGQSAPNSPPLALSSFGLSATTHENPLHALQVVQFAPKTPYIPVWMWGSYLASNITLHILNWYWYGKMISAIRKRFDPPLGTRKKDPKEDVKEEVTVSRGVDASGRKLLEVDSVETRKRVPIQRLQSSEMPPPN